MTVTGDVLQSTGAGVPKNEHDNEMSYLAVLKQ